MVVIISVTIGIFGGVFAVAVMNGAIEQRVDAAMNEEISHIHINDPQFRDNYDIRARMNALLRQQGVEVVLKPASMLSEELCDTMHGVIRVCIAGKVRPILIDKDYKVAYLSNDGKDVIPLKLDMDEEEAEAMLEAFRRTLTEAMETMKEHQ